MVCVVNVVEQSFCGSSSSYKPYWSTQVFNIVSSNGSWRLNLHFTAVVSPPLVQLHLKSNFFSMYILSDNTSRSSTSEQDYGLCKKGEVLESYVLRGGRKAGAYYKIGSAANYEECVDLCCSNDDCNLALFVKSSCYSVECKSAELCKPIKVHRKSGIQPWIFRRYRGKSRDYSVSYYIIFWAIQKYFIAIQCKSYTLRRL